MPKLNQSLVDWGTVQFSQALLQELRALEAGVLPLQSVSQGGWIDFSEITISITKQSSDQASLYIVMGVFFTETAGGGSCGFEAEAQQNYCDMQVVIDCDTAEAVFTVL